VAIPELDGKSIRLIDLATHASGLPRDSYIAFAPTRGVGVFVSMNEFNVAGFPEMANAANDLITEIAPR
jgi:CubicO group peptidase (beta-lactamase class C family)